MAADQYSGLGPFASHYRGLGCALPIFVYIVNPQAAPKRCANGMQMRRAIKLDRFLICGLFPVGVSFFSHSATSAVKESLLFTFGKLPIDGRVPVGALIQGKDGNFYGVTSGVGGGNDLDDGGTIFKLSPSGVETVLHNFPADSTDGYNPQGGLIQGSDGAFYGTTASGGTKSASHGGTTFKLVPSRWGVLSV